MSFKSIAICRLPHSNEIQIYTGTIVKSSVLEFELTERPQFILTSGLNPDEIFGISGDVYSTPMNSSTANLLETYLQSLGDSVNISAENSFQKEAENFRGNNQDINPDYLQNHQNGLNDFNRDSNGNKYEGRLNGNELEHLISENINDKSFVNLQNRATTLEQFTEEIESIKTAISSSELEKVVAARIIRRDIRNQQFDFSSLVEWYVKLCENYSDCLIYLFVDSDLGIWIGASPELLFERDATGISHTVSLAGTLFGESESWSEKEKLEQSTTSQHIHEILKEFNLEAEVSQLQERKNGALRHLISQYSFNTKSSQILDILNRLNPTPAVIGYPQKVALNWVKKQLSLNRELYSGAVGIISTQKTLIHVNLRCAKVYLNQQIDLFAGCGINSMSDPLREWQETQLKSEIIGKFIPNLSSLKD